MGACRREVRLLARVAGFVLVLSACTTNPPPVEAPQPAPMPDMPSTIRPEEVVGRWARFTTKATARARRRPPEVNAASRS
jgi:starvation-inducible outer membrane lipoprotein